MKLSEKQIQEALNVKFESDLGKITIRKWFENLLLTLWDEQERFSGKRPFGNSDWAVGPIFALVAKNFIPGSHYDPEDFYPESWEVADKVMNQLIKACFKQGE
jgi:hypothetical protein